MNSRLTATPACITGVICLFLLTACDLGVETEVESTVKKIDVTADARPNILLIVVDDMGYTDLGAFGSEIATPNIDELAMSGVRLTNFHASAQCAPTRAMLMSGTNNHTAGMGAMFGKTFIEGGFGDRRGYERYLHPRVASLPERMNEAGYNTYMAGKWHLGGDDEKKPTARGFDRAFALMQGSASHLEHRHVRPIAYRENGTVVESLPVDFYSTDFYTEKIIEYIGEHNDQDGPFFAYLALTAPHWPLQVPSDYLELHRGKYEHGYDVQRQRRLTEAAKLGVIPEVDASLFDPTGATWESLSEEEQRYSTRTMELYAAMMTNLDDNIGRLIGHLDATGNLNNTIVFFMSDNGAEADREDLNSTHAHAIKSSNHYDNNYDNLGTITSFPFLREGWAQAATAPFRLYKGFLTEGGTRVASFIWQPSTPTNGTIDNQYLNVMDVMPTLLDLAKAKYDPGMVQGREVLPMQGRSFSSILSGSNEPVHPDDEIIAFEIHGQRAIRQGSWKAVWEQMSANISWADDQPPPHWLSWRLFNLAEDPTEQHDLAEEEPQKLAELIQLWDEWAAANNVKTEITPRWPDWENRDG